MKKYLSSVIAFIFVFVVGTSEVASTTIIQGQHAGKATIVMINGFESEDLNDLMASTSELGNGDKLTIRSYGPGGDALVCMSMILYVDSLKEKGVKVRTETWSYAASANFFVWLSGEDRAVHGEDLLMSHLIVPRNAYGKVVPIEELDAVSRMVVDHLNDWITQRVHKITKSKYKTKQLVGGEDNWFTGLVMYRLGVATELM